MNKRKTKTTKLITIILLLTIITAIMLAGTFAKYTKQVSGDGTGVIARWSFKVNGLDNPSLTATNIQAGTVANDRIAPGTKGYFNVGIDVTGCEVAVKYKVEITNIENKPENLHFYEDAECATKLEENSDTYELTGIVLVNDPERIKTIPIYWKWDYEVASLTPDELDTQRGVSPEDMKLVIKITGSQYMGEGQKNLPIKWTDKNGDGVINVGETIQAGGIEYYALKTTSSEVTLIATESVVEEPTAFSQTNYWQNATAEKKADLNTIYLQPGKVCAIKTAQNYGTALGGEGSLLTLAEVEEIQATNPTILQGVTTWLATAGDNGEVYKLENGTVTTAMYTETSEIRPLIKIPNETFIVATATYDEENNKILIQVTQSKNEISQIMDEQGNILSKNSMQAEYTGEIGNKTYIFTVVDKKGNVGNATIKLNNFTKYIIANENDLNDFRTAVNNGKTNSSTEAYQIADIKLNEGKYTIDEDGIVNFNSDAEPWKCIGTTYNKYSGSYYGNNHTISGVYINTTGEKQGVFASVVTGSSINDLGIINSRIKGGQYTGSIVGYMDGASSLNNCFSNATIDCSANNCGGLIGYIHSSGAKINRCYTKNIFINYEEKTNIGGIVGWMYTTEINECYSDCVFKITNASKYATGIGGIVGCSIAGGTITNCYNISNIIGQRAGGILR